MGVVMEKAPPLFAIFKSVGHKMQYLLQNNQYAKKRQRDDTVNSLNM